MNSPLVRWSGFVLVCLLAGLLYLPGLDSGFQLDDAYNLHLLERIPRDGFASYVFSGLAGPGGRPLSLFTFAIQHPSWPQHPEHFKAVNLGLHLANGLLVFLVAGRLAGRLPGQRGPAWPAALLAAALWLVHPMHMTTVLYVIQRMTQLSTLFMLLGMYGWLRGREACEAGAARRGYLLMSLSVAAGTVCATLSKENGALLPLLLLITEATLLSGRPLPPPYRAWRLVFLVLPCVALGAYLAWTLPLAAAGYFDRPYGIVEKTVTEAAVLWHYAFNLVVPRPGAFGLYHDDFPVARALLDPPWTLPAVLGIAVLAAAAWRWRRRAPLPAFAVLWFLAGHLLESTYLDLEIYFEHRNYLPSIGIALALGAAVTSFVFAAPARHWAVAGTMAYLALLCWISFQNAVITRVPLLAAYEAVRNHPGSFGAHVLLGNRYVAERRPWEALELYRRMEEFFPDLVYPRLKRTAVRGCVLGERLDDAWWRETLEVARTGRARRYEVVAELDTILSAVFEGECRTIERRRLLALVETLTGNPAFAAQRGMLHELAANLCISMSEWPAALRHMRQAARASPTWNRQLRVIELEAGLGLYAAAAAKLERLKARLALRPLVAAAHAARLERVHEQIEAGSAAPQ